MSLPQLNLVNVEVKIDGEITDYVSLNLKQTITGHHSFNMVVKYRPDKPSVWTVTPEKIFEQLGTPVSINMKHKESGETTDFYGVITNINVKGADGNQGFLEIVGGSPTLLLDMDPSMESYVDYTQANIISEVLENSGVDIELSSKPHFTSIIPYVARYKETSFEFISRLASSCGDWLYYDGKKLVLGNPRIETDTRAAYDMELSNINISSRIGNLNREIYDYDPIEDEYREDAPLPEVEGINSYMRVARKKSERFFPKVAKMPCERKMVHVDDIIDVSRAKHSARISQMSVFTAKSNTCIIRLGEMVITRLPKSLQVDVGPDLGRYKVMKIDHYVNAEGQYYNVFEGVAGATESLTDGHITYPVAYPEPAIVIDNQDPEKMGRVKVRFYWMTEDLSSNWMRVQSHNLGGADNQQQMHGSMFVPSVDDQVMVAFAKGDPSRPYITGSLMHKNNSSGASADHTISKIVSFSGHTIEFNDTEGEESINIYDKEGSAIQYNTAEKSIKIQSAENIDISAKNISITAEEKISFGAKTDLEFAAEGNLIGNVKGDLALQSTGDTTIKSKADLAIEATTDATIKGQNTILEGSVKAELNGAQTKVTGSATSEVSGSIVKVN